jgi:hypothetical protein
MPEKQAIAGSCGFSTGGTGPQQNFPASDRSRHLAIDGRSALEQPDRFAAAGEGWPLAEK